MKKKIVALALSALMVTGLVGCGSDNNSSTSKEGTLKVGMVTNTGTIDDKSFNQGTWEGIKKLKKSLDLKLTIHATSRRNRSKLFNRNTKSL